MNSKTPEKQSGESDQEPQDLLRALLLQSREQKQHLLGKTEAIYDENDPDWQLLFDTISGDEASFLPEYYESVNPAGITYPWPLRSIRNMIYGRFIEGDRYSVLAGANTAPIDNTCLRIVEPATPLREKRYRTVRPLPDSELFEEDKYTPDYVIGLYLQGQVHFEELVGAVLDTLEMETSNDRIAYLELAVQTVMSNTKQFPDLEPIFNLSDMNTEYMWLAHAIYSLFRNKNVSFRSQRRKLIELADETFVTPVIESLIRQERKQKQQEQPDGDMYEFRSVPSEELTEAVGILRDTEITDPDRIHAVFMEMDLEDENLAGAIGDILGFHTLPNRRPMGIQRASEVYGVSYYAIIKILTKLFNLLDPPQPLSLDNVNDIVYGSRPLSDPYDGELEIYSKPKQDTSIEPADSGKTDEGELPF